MIQTKTNRLSNGLVICILALICCFLWGSAFPSIKLGYKFLQISSNDIGSQILFAGLRFTLAGILTIVLGSIRQKQWLIPKQSSFPLIVKLSLVQTVFQYFFFYVGLAHTTGVKGSIITASNVYLSIFISSYLAKQEKMTGKKRTGCIIGFIGVVLINLKDLSMDFSMTWNGEFFIFLSALSYACSSVMIKNYSQKENPIILSGYQFFFGGLILSMVGLLRHGQLGPFTGPGIGILLYLAFVSSTAYTIWAILLANNPIGKVAVYGFMNPVFGVLLSALFLKETSQAFGLIGVISLLFVCAGIFLVNKSE